MEITIQGIENETTVVQKAFKEALESLAYAWLESIAECESPIEKALYPALACELTDYQAFNPELSMQYEIKNHNGKIVRRADFMIIVNGNSSDEMRFIVECDSHQYHDTNPKQIKKDRLVDAKLLSQGYRTIRVNGVDIHKDVLAVAEHICSTMLDCLLEQSLRKNGDWDYGK